MHHNRRGRRDCDSPATPPSPLDRTTVASSPVRSWSAHTRGPRWRYPASPRSQEVTTCSSESSCCWPWGARSSRARRPVRGPQRVLKPWLRSIRQHRVTADSRVRRRARCRASLPRRRDLTTRTTPTPGPPWGPAFWCPPWPTPRSNQAASSCGCYAPAYVRCPAAKCRPRQWVTYPGRAQNPS